MPIRMNALKVALAGAVATATLAATADADSHGAPNPAVVARQGHMSIMSLNIGILGQMARGNTEYDAEAAQAAADNLLAMAQVDQRFYWVPGTDSESIEGTRALPAIWAEDSTVGEIAARYADAAAGLAAVAGDGLDAMRGAMGPVGGTCGDCHDNYRQAR